MRCLFLLLFLSLIAQVASAQNHAQKKLIRFAIGKDNIWYNDKVHSSNIDFVRETLSKDTLFDWRYMTLYEKRGLPDSLVFVLTKSEQAFINKELDDMKDFRWKKNLFKKSLVVNFDAMMAYKKTHDGKLNFNTDDYKNGGYAFSKPILIRNNTVGFIYLEYHGGKVLMYIKDKNQWRIKYVLNFWVS
jgi:hypothetical protein